MKSAVIQLPGLNRDRDMIAALTKISGKPPLTVWQTETELPDVDLIVIPGGFSYGDYLRCGAIAARMPVMRAVAEKAAQGVLVMGVCNGFQILLEAGLLPGAMLRNTGNKYRCEYVHVRVEQTDTPFTGLCSPGQVLKIPIAHGEGNYYADPETLAALEANRQVIFRYVRPDGTRAPDANPNGSANDIAGICNAARNVVGLMPHPERACESPLGSEDGRIVLQSVVEALTTHGR